jgi:hypothetical protein
LARQNLNPTQASRLWFGWRIDSAVDGVARRPERSVIRAAAA